MSFEINYGSSGLSGGIDKMTGKLGAVILMYSATKAKKIEARMKINRPWTDRSNQAKATLSAKVSQPSIDKVRITLAHGVEYGLWLELANEKNYAIIGPTIQEEGPFITSDLRDIMSKLK